MAKGGNDRSAQFSGFDAGMSGNAAGTQHVEEFSDDGYVDASGESPVGSEYLQNQQHEYGGRMDNGDAKFGDFGGDQEMLRFDDIEIVVESPGRYGHGNGNENNDLAGEGMEGVDLGFGSFMGNGTGIGTETTEYGQFYQGVDGGDQFDELLWKQGAGYENAQIDPVGQPESPFQGYPDNLTIEQLERDDAVKELSPTTEDVVEITGNETFESLSKNSNRRSRRGRERTSTLAKKTRALRSSSANTSISESTVELKPVVLGLLTTTERASDTREHKRKRGRKRQADKKSEDEYSKLRKHLRYLLHRVQKERNLIDAYSSEGWRGQSLEKIRLEKAINRAQADTNRFKTKIRALFQRLDQVIAEGRFPESLFDSEGMIDSEDIYCAKCGSKEVTSKNDIILCDGACERGFHQFCLDPPLRTEEIPPGDEGWLCPTCDCKVDCIDLLNNSEGTKFSIKDSWERIFPEAVASADGQDDSFGLPSDDSEDSEFDPSRAADDSDRSKGGSTSDESDFSSASEDLGALVCGDQKVDLRSDDSEDNDYDPEAPDADALINEESSSSDFTSASEDLGASVADKDGQPSSFPEPDVGLDDSLPVSGKRDVERLDYKKLYDETYEDASSESSDDEEWTKKPALRKRTSRSRRASSVSSDGGSPLAADGVSNISRKTRFSPRAKASGSPSVEGATDSHEHWPGEFPKPSSTAKRAHKRLGVATTQRLYASFKENQYPDNPTKEKLALELGITAYQVKKWFENARFSYNHSHPEAGTSKVIRRGRRKPDPKNTPLKDKAVAFEDVAGGGSHEVSATSDATLQRHGSSGSREAELFTTESPVQNRASPKSWMTEDAKAEHAVVLGLQSSEEVIAKDSSQMQGSPEIRSCRKRKASGA